MLNVADDKTGIERPGNSKSKHAQFKHAQLSFTCLLAGFFKCILSCSAI